MVRPVGVVADERTGRLRAAVGERERHGDGEGARAAMLAHLAGVAVLTRDAYPAC